MFSNKSGLGAPIFESGFILGGRFVCPFSSNAERDESHHNQPRSRAAFVGAAPVLISPYIRHRICPQSNSAAEMGSKGTAVFYFTDSAHDFHLLQG